MYVLSRSAAHGSHFFPQSPLQAGSALQDSAALQASQPQPSWPQLGSGAQNSEHFTTQTVFLTSFISQTTLQYFSHSQRAPQWLHCEALPQVCTSEHAPGVLQASPAIAVQAINQPRARGNTTLLIFDSPSILCLRQAP